MLKLISACALCLSVTNAAAQGSFRIDEVEALGEAHGCDPQKPLNDVTEYVLWVEFLESVMAGTTADDFFTKCPHSPYIAYTDLFSKKINSSDYSEQTKALSSLFEWKWDRISQGLGASEYVLFSYMLCQADEDCFSSALDRDRYWEAMCSTGDTDSPSEFELNLFRHGGDMKYLLPYAVTNCDLLEESGDRNAYIYGISKSILNP